MKRATCRNFFLILMFFWKIINKQFFGKTEIDVIGNQYVFWNSLGCNVITVAKNVTTMIIRGGVYVRYVYICSLRTFIVIIILINIHSVCFLL